MKQVSFVTHADLLHFYVGAEFRMEMLDGLLSHKLYPDNEITLSVFICAGGRFIYIGHRVSQPETLPKALLRTNSHLLTLSYSVGASICIQSSLERRCLSYQSCPFHTFVQLLYGNHTANLWMKQYFQCRAH